MKKLWTFLFLLMLFVSAGNNTKAQYCTTGLYAIGGTNNCLDGDNINNFIFNTINHIGSGCSTDGYGDFTTMSTTLAPGMTYTLTVTTQYTSSEFLKVWIDFNDDFNFDPSELIDSSFTSFGSAAPYVKDVTIPLTATPGTHRMRARLVYNNSAFQACTPNLSFGEVHDYTVTIAGSVPTMTYASSTTTQNANDVGRNSVNQQIIGIQVVTNSGIPAINATQFNLNTNGTTAPVTDIANAKLWYTGSSGTFATTNQFGTTVAAPNGTFSFNGSQTLVGGLNYFWLTYDIPNSAINNNFADAECTSIVVNDTSRIPTVTAPAGARQIKNELIIGTGTLSSDLQPIDRYYNYSAWEAIYLQSEMGSAKDLTHIGFFKASGTDVTAITNVFIYMKHTTKDTVETGTIEDTSSYTLVYSGNFTNNATSGWMTVALNNIFSYNGTNNLKIILKKYHQAFITARPYYNYTTVATNRSKYMIDDNIVPNNKSLTKTTMLPNVRFSFQLPQPMAYISSATNHPSTQSVMTNTTNNVILGVQVVTQGALAPILNASSFTFNTNGTTNPLADITNAKLWYSGTSTNPATAVQIGSSIAGPSGNMIFNTGTGFPVTLAPGTNYFWLTYDIPSTATLYNVIDAELNSITISGNNYTPSPSAPTGNRTIRTALSGIYTIDNTLPSAGLNYNNFIDATNDLNVLGISGPVTFNVTSGQVFPIICPASPNNYGIAIATTGTPAWPIVFRKNGTNANPQLLITGTSATNDIGVFIFGSDYVKFDGIDIYDGGTSTTNYLEFGYYLQGPVNNGCQYDTIMNCVVNLNKANTSSRAIFTNVNSPTAAVGANSFNVFLNNTLQNAYNGYYFVGNSTIKDKFNFVNGGTIDNIGNNVATTLYGIYASNQDTMRNSNLTITNLGATTTLYAAYYTGCHGIQFNNNNISGITNTTSSSYGYYSTTSNDVTVSNNTFRNFVSTSGAHYILWPTSASNVQIFNNTIRNITSTSGVVYGIYPTSISGNSNIFNNLIYSFTSGGSLYPLYIGSANNNITLNTYNNRIYDIFYNGTSTGIIYGIYTGLGSSFTTVTSNIYNNLVYDLRSPAGTSATAVAGVYVASGILVNLFYNTVLINYSSTAANNGSSALFTTSTPTTIDVRNNIFINKTDVTTGLRAIAHQRNSTTYTNLSANMNFNIYFSGIPSIKRAIHFNGTNTDSTLAQYRVRMGAREQASKTEDVAFLSSTTPYDLKINVSIPTRAESGGQAITNPLVNIDIDGVFRFGHSNYTGTGQAPDIGAYEFAGIILDDVPPIITYTPMINRTIGAPTILNNVNITDLSGVNTTTFKPRIYYKKTVNANTFNDNTNSTDGWKFSETTSTGNPFAFNIDYNKINGGVIVGDTVQYFVISQDLVTPANVGTNSAGLIAPSSVNLSASNFPATGTINSYRISPAINGTYNVGIGNPLNCLTCNGDTGVFRFVNSSVLTGNVEFVITSNLNETGTIALNQFAEEGAGNYTITFKPQNDIPDTIRGSFSGGLIRLNGADRVIFDGRYSGTGNYLTFANTGTSGSVFLISSLGTGLGATDNIIRNSNIYMGGNGSGTFGISIGGTSVNTTGAHNHNNSILFNNIYRVYVGVFAQGIATTGIMNNLTVEGNNMGHDVISLSLGHDGVMVANTTGSLIKGNKIFNCVNTNTTSRGITLSTNTLNTNVYSNYIDNFKYTGTAGYGSHGIFVNTGVATSNLNIVNNVINRMSGDGWSTYTGSSQAGILIDGANTGGINIYYNTVSLIGEFTRASTATMTAALAISSTTASGLNVRNNIFSNTQRNNNVANTVSRNYAIHSFSPISAFTSLDYNLYNVHDTSIQARVGNINNTQYLTLLNWQNATILDLNSKQGNPMFLDSTNLYLDPASPAIGSALPITGFDKDINNTNRSTFAPTIGAYEFIPTNKTLNLTLFLEGLFNGVNMNPVWDENGEHFGPTIADAIEVKLMNGLDPTVEAATFTGVMLQTNGTCSINVPSQLGDSYYIVVKHRNSIMTWSATPLSFTGNTINYNFTNNIASAYGDNLKEVATGVYAIFVGDVNQDEVIDLSDLVAMDFDLTEGTVAYIVYDLNGDGVVDLSDLVAIDENLTNGVVSMYP